MNLCGASDRNDRRKMRGPKNLRTDWEIITSPLIDICFVGYGVNSTCQRTVNRRSVKTNIARRNSPHTVIAHQSNAM